MLASLRIRNLALAEDLLWEPPAGFVSVTGETGAGKSMLIGGLKLLLGDRADRSTIRSGADQCTVEAEFLLEDLGEIAPLLDASGVEPCEEGRLILRRLIPASGTGRQFVNGSPANLSLLRELGQILVDLHGPHDHQSLFSRKRQTRILDAYAAADDLREAYRSKRETLTRLRREAEEIAGGDPHALAREADLLRHQIEEIDSAELSPEDDTELIQRHRAASNAQRVTEVCAQLDQAIEGETLGVIDRLAEVGKLLQELARLDGRSEPLLERHDDVMQAVAELAAGIRHAAEQVDLDPETLAALETRIDLVQSLRKKYGESFEEIFAYGDTCRDRLAGIESRQQRSESIAGEIAAAERETRTAGEKLTKARTKAAARLEKEIEGQLAQLGFPQASFAIRFERLEEPGPLGLEESEFFFAPNPGEPSAPLRSIASSGEISRVMLALKSALADLDQVPLLVFDEIDSNVGGEIAVKVAAKLADLARRHQVVCITHLPQVAARATSHFLVEKQVGKTRTHSTLRRLGADERETELARMLGGTSDSALRHARELLQT